MELAGATPVATGWQITLRRKRLKQAKTVAVRCDRLPRQCHGKEGSTFRAFASAGTG
jgi:hypothetical protein